MEKLISSTDKVTTYVSNSEILIITSSIKIDYKSSKNMKYYLIITVLKIHEITHDTKYNVFSFDLSSNNWDLEIHDGICKMEKVLSRQERHKVGSHVGHNLNHNHLIHEKLKKIEPFGTYRTRIINVGSLLLRNRNYLSKCRGVSL